MRNGGDGGPAVVAGKSAESLLIDAVTGGEDWRMPPARKGEPLTAEEIARLKAWIDAGAQAPDETEPERPARALGVPAAGPARGPRGQGRGLGPQPDRRLPRRRARSARAHAAPRPTRRTLLRRVYLDLIGLPPTPEELRAFLADPVPGRLREGRRPPARQPAVRRALGAALDGRLAVQRLGRLPERRSATASRTSGAGATGSSSRSTPTRATTG